jgi:hypothetical protein
MGTRALEFSRTHPDPSPGYAAALSRLEERLTRAAQLATQQRNGIIETRTASAVKRDLRRQMRRSQLVHLASVAEIASKEVPELEQKFVLAAEDTPFLTFRTAARAMEAEAQGQKELLVKHGLTDTVLESLTLALDQFDQAIQQGVEGRREHVGASAELDSVASEVTQIVRVMDGLNRYRFSKDTEALASWESSSNTFGPMRAAPVKPPSGEPTSGGEIKPAA